MTIDLTNEKPTVKEIREMTKELEEHMCRMTTSEINKLVEELICPECGNELSNGGNCHLCSTCGWSKC